MGWQNLYMSEQTVSNDAGLPDYDEGQLSASDTLIDRGVADPLDEGYVAPDNWSVAQGYGNTAEEARRGESVEQRIKQEEPETTDEDKGPWNPHQEPRQVGQERAGRLVATADGKITNDKEGDAVAKDVGISGGAASAEEAAMHIIDEDEIDRQNKGEEE